MREPQLWLHAAPPSPAASQPAYAAFSPREADLLFEGHRTGFIPCIVQMDKALGVSAVAVGKAMR